MSLNTKIHIMQYVANSSGQLHVDCNNIKINIFIGSGKAGFTWKQIQCQFQHDSVSSTWQAINVTFEIIFGYTYVRWWWYTSDHINYIIVVLDNNNMTWILSYKPM